MGQKQQTFRLKIDVTEIAQTIYLISILIPI